MRTGTIRERLGGKIFAAVHAVLSRVLAQLFKASAENTTSTDILVLI